MKKSKKKRKPQWVPRWQVTEQSKAREHLRSIIGEKVAPPPGVEPGSRA